jgi:6,7-dimethyl-8-ribityllumazine synthase
MVKRYESSLTGDGLRIGVVVSRFNSVVTERLLDGALDGLRRHGVADAAVELASVPGAFELPIIAELMARRRYAQDVDAIVCLGAVVKGETPHFDMIAQWVVAELGRLSVAHHMPIALGVLTTNTIEQALERSGGKHGNKGYDAALVAIEMANLVKQVAG